MANVEHGMCALHMLSADCLRDVSDLQYKIVDILGTLTISLISKKITRSKDNIIFTESANTTDWLVCVYS
jgi:hypothetical protein